MVRRSSSMGHRGSGQQKGRGDGGGGSSSGGGGDQREELSSQDQKERSVDSREEERRLRRNDYNGEDEEEEDIGNMPREKILQRIRHHKEIIGKVRLQPWPMRRKRRALKVARQYLQKQEAQVSKWHLYKVEASRRGNQVDILGRRIWRLFRLGVNEKLADSPQNLIRNASFQILCVQSHFLSTRLFVLVP